MAAQIFEVRCGACAGETMIALACADIIEAARRRPPR